MMLEQVLAQYTRTAVWAETDADGTPLDARYTVAALAPETLARMTQDVAAFVESARQCGLGPALDERPAPAGHALWLTRNRHGAGFWDGDWPALVGERLTALAHRLGEVTLYVGDDGLLYQG